MRVERVVIDTNVLISAVLSPLGLPFGCLGWVHDNTTLIVSKETAINLAGIRLMGSRLAAVTYSSGDKIS